MIETATKIQVGQAYRHTIHGNCVVVYQNRGGYWLQVWGGPCGDKLYTLKGVEGKDLVKR